MVLWKTLLQCLNTVFENAFFDCVTIGGGLGGIIVANKLLALQIILKEFSYRGEFNTRATFIGARISLALIQIKHFARAA